MNIVPIDGLTSLILFQIIVMHEWRIKKENASLIPCAKSGILRRDVINSYAVLIFVVPKQFNKNVWLHVN